MAGPDAVQRKEIAMSGAVAEGQDGQRALAPLDARAGALFKAYDVRGIVPDELTPEIAYRTGRGIVAFLGADTVVIGRDMRISGPVLATALIEGVRDQGADAVDIGLVSTDTLYFAVGKYGYPAGVMLTASHNPAAYNGFKICREEARALSLDTGLAEIRDLVVSGQFPAPASERRGSVQQRNVLDAYVEHALGFIDPAAIKPFKIAVDAGNGMAGELVPRVFKHLPCEIVPLYFELDGTFPNHEANPIEPENIRDLRRLVTEQGCDLGVAFDGDADRMFLIDEHGEFIGGDMTTAMVAIEMLKHHPGAPIVYNLICSRTVPEVIVEQGGRPIRSRVGHSYIKATMREEDAVFGGEHSGHFYFRDNWYADSGLIAMLSVLQLMSASDQSLAQVLEPIDIRFRSGEINSEVKDVAATMARVEAEYSAQSATIDHLDGLTVGFDEWWFNLRASNTQPLLRLNVEAEDRATLQEKTAEVVALVRQE
ncbi:MAG: phosphomannomutase/phosphoglucomutase [Chloroflexota bacterium]|nr:phosphomannomutase/phosphoglucomutase [Chloroflexota bacterium]